MQLLTQAIRDSLPALGSQDGTPPANVKIHVKFFDPTGSWTWFATEFDGEDTFFGMVHGFEKELGYFSLTELASVKGALGLGIERDLHYSGHTLDEVMP
jgi:hypothetical protein